MRKASQRHTESNLRNVESEEPPDKTEKNVDVEKTEIKQLETKSSAPYQKPMPRETVKPIPIQGRNTTQKRAEDMMMKYFSAVPNAQPRDA